MVNLVSRYENFIRVLIVAFLITILIWAFSISWGLDLTKLKQSPTGEVKSEDLTFALEILGRLGGSVGNIAEIRSTASNAGFIVSLGLACLTIFFGIIRKETINQVLNDFKANFPISSFEAPETGKDDIELMCSYYEKASNIFVLAGDFDWLNGENNISKIVKEIATTGKIRFLSSTNRERVESSMNEKLFKICLPYFTCNVPGNFKASFVHLQGGKRCLLYKIERGPEHPSKIIAINNVSPFHEPLERFHGLLDSLQISPFVVLICGESGSGKSELAHNLCAATKGQLVSVGSIIREFTELSGGDPQCRNTNVETGVRYLKILGGQALAQEVRRRVNKQDDVVIIDGLRPVETISELKSIFPKHITIYVHADYDVRVNRIQKKEGYDLNGFNDEIDRMGTPMKNISSTLLLYNNSDDKDDFIKKAFVEINTHAPKLCRQ